MVKHEVSINIPSKNNFLVTNIFPLGTQYAQHMQAYQTVRNAVQVEITFEETLF